MARVSRPDEENKETADPTQGQPEALGGAEAAQAAGGGGGGGTAAAPQRARFTDISRLLNANQGQGQRVANNAISGAEQLAQSAQSQLGAAQGQYQQQVATATPKGYTAAPNVAAAAPKAQVVLPTPYSPAPPQNGLARAAAAPTPVNTFSSPITMDAARAAAGSSYTGPTALGNSSVNLAPVAGAYNNAEQAYQALAQSPSHGTGGAGVLDDALALHESGGQLKAAAGRFQGLRDQFNQATTDTTASDAAKASTTKSAAAGQADVDAYDTKQAADAKAATDDQNKKFQQEQKEDSDYQSFLRGGLGFGDPRLAGHSLNGFNNTIDGIPARDWFHQNYPSQSWLTNYSR